MTTAKPSDVGITCRPSKVDKVGTTLGAEEATTVSFGGILRTLSRVRYLDVGITCRPSKVDGSGVPWVLKKLARLINLFLRKVAVVFRSAWRCLLVLNAPLARVSRKLSTRRRVRSRARGGLRPRDEEEQEEEEEEEEDEEGSLLAVWIGAGGGSFLGFDEKCGLWFGGFFLACEDLGRIFHNSFSACAFFFVFC